MKLLLDECVDRRLAAEFVGHDVVTVPQAGWAGVKNGQLLTLAQDRFDVFVTVDQNLPFQQSLGQFRIAVLVLAATSTRLNDLRPLVPKALAVLASCRPGTATSVGPQSLGRQP